MLIKFVDRNVEYCGKQNREPLLSACPHGPIMYFPEMKSSSDLIFSELATLPTVPHA